jgi:hypothetical protein
MGNMKILLGVTVIAMLTLSAGVAWADEVTSEINYQGRLADKAGSPLSGTYTMTFRLYEAATGGTALDTDIHDVVVTDGLFNTEIDFDQSYFDGRALWLGIKVGTDSEMIPRQDFRPVPYALSLVPGAKIIGAAQWNLNVETTNASGRALQGQASAASGTNYGVVGVSRSPDGYGGYFYNDEGGVGVYGKSDSGFAGYFDGKVHVSDNVGIGTTNPTSYLSIKGNFSMNANNRLEDTASISLDGKHPGLKFHHNTTGEENAWLFLAYNDSFVLYQNNNTTGGWWTAPLTILNKGNLGIGTASPSAKLHVQSDDDNAQVNIWSTGAAKDAVLMFGTATGGQNFYLTLDEDDGRKFKMGPGVADNKLVIQQNGNVGIGTTSPGAKLDVRGTIITSGPNIELTEQASGNRHSFIDFHGDDTYTDYGLRVIRGNTGANAESCIQHRGTGILRLSTRESGSHIVLQPAGNVGIGTTSPDSKLHVRATDRPTIMAEDNFGGLMSGAGGGHGVFGTNLYVDSKSQLKTAGTHSRGYGYSGMHATWGNMNFYAKGGVNTNANAAITPESRLHIRGSDGNVGIGTTSPGEKLTVRGNVLIESESTGMAVVELGEGLDYAEGFDVSDMTGIVPGAVLIIDPDRPGELTISDTPYDTKVAGIVDRCRSQRNGLWCAPWG